MSDKENTSFTSKKLARLVAVQALYRASYDEESLADVLKNTLEQASAANDNEDDAAGIPVLGKPDAELFSSIVKGVVDHKADLEDMLKGSLDARFSLDRMEILLRNILLAGAFELHHHPGIEPGIIINDYVDVARSFFNAKEPGLVNAILDRLAQKLRS